MVVVALLGERDAVVGDSGHDDDVGDNDFAKLLLLLLLLLFIMTLMMIMMMRVKLRYE